MTFKTLNIDTDSGAVDGSISLETSMVPSFPPESKL